MIDIRATTLLAEARQMQQLCRALCQEAEEVRVIQKKLRVSKAFACLSRQLERHAQELEERALEAQRLGQVLARAAELAIRTERLLVGQADGAWTHVCAPPPPGSVTIEEKYPAMDLFGCAPPPVEGPWGEENPVYSL